MRFNYDISHTAGKELHTADALSRAPTSSHDSTDVNFVRLIEDYAECLHAYLPATDARLSQVLEHQNRDAACQQLTHYVLSGWPRKQTVPTIISPFYPHRANITLQNDLLMFGPRLIIPQSLRKEILEKLHEGHLGIVKCRSRTQDSVVARLE